MKSSKSSKNGSIDWILSPIFCFYCRYFSSIVYSSNSNYFLRPLKFKWAIIGWYFICLLLLTFIWLDEDRLRMMKSVIMSFIIYLVVILMLFIFSGMIALILAEVFDLGDLFYIFSLYRNGIYVIKS
jgi:hypothetical protein